MTTTLPTTNNGYVYACPYPGCRNSVGLTRTTWLELGPDTADLTEPHSSTWVVECIGGHILWQQTDEAAHRGDDITEPHDDISVPTVKRITNILRRLTRALADIPFTELCHWCGTATATTIVEYGHRGGGLACAPCCTEHDLTPTHPVSSRTRAQIDAQS